MPRPPRNPFSILLGAAGIAFTITAMSYSVAVLRGVRPETVWQSRSSLDTFIDRYGTTLLVGELVVLAIATVGAVAHDTRSGGR
ncbi:MAG: hypothetical protein ACK5SI_00805 [Planctomycetia bacterium]|jgi:hypothetical protein